MYTEIYSRNLTYTPSFQDKRIENGAMRAKHLTVCCIESILHKMLFRSCTWLRLKIISCASCTIEKRLLMLHAIGKSRDYSHTCADESYIRPARGTLVDAACDLDIVLRSRPSIKDSSRFTRPAFCVIARRCRSNVLIIVLSRAAFVSF